MTRPSPASGAPMTLIAFGIRSCSNEVRWMRNFPPSSHSKVALPDATPSSCGWVASVTQVPINASNGRMSGSLSFMPVPTGRRCRIHRRLTRPSDGRHSRRLCVGFDLDESEFVPSHARGGLGRGVVAHRAHERLRLFSLIEDYVGQIDRRLCRVA